MTNIDKQFLYDAVMKHAYANYERGWDCVVECYDKSDIFEMLTGTETVEQAIEAVKKEAFVREVFIDESSPFRVRLRTLDGCNEVIGFQSLEETRKYVRDQLGAFDVGSTYLVSFDGIAKITPEFGCSLSDFKNLSRNE
jgi:hypothetical protein